MTRAGQAPSQRWLLAPMPAPVLVAVLLAAAVLGALVAWAWPSPSGVDRLVVLGGGLVGAAMVAAREWVAIALLPEPAYEPPRVPSRVDVPGDVRQRTVAPAPSRPLATTRPNRGMVERLRRARSRVQESTGRDAEAFADHRKREGTIDPMGQELLRRRRLQRGFGAIVTSAALWAVLTAWRLADGPWWLFVLSLATITMFVAAAGAANAVRADRPYRSVVGYSPFTERGCVGGNLAGADFGAAGVFGIAGEKRTAELLETWLGGASRMAVFHSLRFPGSERADIDHAALIGHELFIIDSKAWRGGTYRQESAETVTAPDGHQRCSSMPAAAAALGRIGWGDVRVVTVIHATSGQVFVTTTGHPGHMVTSPVAMVETLLQARDRESNRMPWIRADAARFARHVQQLSAMLVPVDQAGAATASRRAA